jgi:SAM-dependent methyltransferase
MHSCVALAAVCKNRAVIDPSQDAFGAALLDYLEGKNVPELVLEDRGGWAGPAMHPEWFFRSFEQWDWWDRKILPLVEQGPVLDLGAGAGRAALYLQQRGLSVTAVDASPGAVRMAALVEGTGWRIELHEEDGDDHAVLLRRT